MQQSQLFLHKVFFSFVLHTVATAELLLRNGLMLGVKMALKLLYDTKQVLCHLLFHLQVFEELFSLAQTLMLLPQCHAVYALLKKSRLQNNDCFKRQLKRINLIPCCVDSKTICADKEQNKHLNVKFQKISIHCT